jgi:hypothetical protein
VRGRVRTVRRERNRGLAGSAPAGCAGPRTRGLRKPPFRGALLGARAMRLPGIMDGNGIHLPVPSKARQVLVPELVWSPRVLACRPEPADAADCRRYAEARTNVASVGVFVDIYG